MTASRAPSPSVGDELRLEVERPAAGGRMLARHEGRIAFVSGAIPGELVQARVVRVAKGVVHAEVTAVLRSSSDRRPQPVDARCGGHVLGHVQPARQVRLKAEIIEDAFRRLARHPLSTPPEVVPSPESGYRMRSRFHVQGHRIGFLREGTHQLCRAGDTGQLHPASVAWIDDAERWLVRQPASGLLSVDMAEDLSGRVRACHLELGANEDPARYRALGASLGGLSAHAVGQSEVVTVTNPPVIVDHIPANGTSVRLARDAQAFFQGNRYLLEPLVAYVTAQVPDGPVLDLYAGVGLFGLSLAAAGRALVTLVEGDPIGGRWLVENAEPFGSGVQAFRLSVEEYLEATTDLHRADTVVLDPPRTGLSPSAVAGLLGRRPARIVYVSCDVATLARDARLLFEGGYELEGLRGFDLFPNTAHIESVATFVAP